MVSEWISVHSLSLVLVTGTPLWFQLPDVPRARDAPLAHRSALLSIDSALVLCHFGTIRMETTLVIFSGLPGTGKSTLADRLARQLHWPCLCIDDVIGEVPENAGIAFWDSRVQILLRLVEVQLDLGLNVIADSVFMNMDRHHAQELARKYQARFRPVYVFVSDENTWKERVTTRYAESKDAYVPTWAQIKHQRERFRTWEPETALFIDSLDSVDQNYATVLNFVTKDEVALKPLSEIPLVEGRYHG